MQNTALDRLHSLRVADAMAPQAFSVNVRHSLRSVAAIFGEHHITWAPVVDDEHRCVGVFSVADLMKLRGSAAALRFDSDEAVSNLMSAEIHTIAADASLLEASSIMCDRHVHRLPVLGRHGRLEGVISTMDVVAALLHAVEEVDAALLDEVRREYRHEEE